MDRSYERQCQGKAAFTKRGHARAARRRLHDQHISVYACPHCDLFHIGHYRGPSVERMIRHAVALAVKVWKSQYREERFDEPA